MKLENSYGSVQLIDKKSKRRNPYRIRITTGWTDEGKQLYKTIGYSSSRKKGQQMLAEYYNEPYNLEMNNFTFEDLYKSWYEYKINTNISDKTKRQYDSFRKHYRHVENKPFNEINLKDLQSIIDNNNLTNDYESKVIGIYRQMHKFAKANNMKIGNDISPLVVYSPYIKPNLHQPFTDKEISLLWNNRNEIIDLVLINIYTGIRPGEFFAISKVEDNYFITGSKTEAGKNRVIPLNNKIKDIFHKTYKNGILREIKNEDRYYHRYKSKMAEIGLNNTPYSARHTFASLTHRAGANELITKVIMGHKSNDITKDVYTHKNIEDLIKEVNLIWPLFSL